MSNELEQGDKDLQELAEQQRSGPRTALPAVFSIEATYDEAKSQAAGRPIYVDKEIIEIRLGQDIIRHEVTDQDRRTYALQYTTWKAGENQESVEGFPLSQWGAIPGKALAKEFAHFGIRTVEQLAAAPDSLLQKIGPHLGLKRKACDQVADWANQGPLIKMRDENEALKNRVAALESMVQRQTKDIEAARQNGGALPAVAAAPVPDPRLEQLQAQVAALAAAMQPKKRGRPPKAKPNGVPEESP